MRPPMKALLTFARATLLATSALLIGACSGDSTTQPTSSLAPTAANKSLVGVYDGTYTVTIDPKVSNTLQAPSGSALTIPANAICSLSGSGYGAQYWNSPCAPQTNPITLTFVITNSQTDHPRIDFYPAL